MGRQGENVTGVVGDPVLVASNRNDVDVLANGGGAPSGARASPSPGGGAKRCAELAAELDGDGGSRE